MSHLKFLSQVHAVQQVLPSVFGVWLFFIMDLASFPVFVLIWVVTMESPPSDFHKECCCLLFSGDVCAKRLQE